MFVACSIAHFCLLQRNFFDGVAEVVMIEEVAKVLCLSPNGAPARS